MFLNDRSVQLEVEALYKIDGSVSINLSREQLEELRRGAGLQVTNQLC